MDVGNLQDFVLALEKGSEGYRAHIVDSPAGQAEVTFALPFTAQELEALYAKFGRSPASGPSAPAPSAQAFGKRLFDAVFTPEIYRLFSTSLERARGENAGLRVVLRVSNDPALQSLPWELLCNEYGFLALSTETPVARYLELAQPSRPLAVQPPVRALVVIANPSDYPALDVNAEYNKLEDALGQVVESGFFQVDRLARANLNDLLDQLRKNQYHILHFIGHGSFDENSQTAALIWESDDGTGQYVSSEQLAMLLRDHRELRLIVLNACEGARASSRDAFAGIAQTLIRQGLPAVVSMQFAVTDQGARTFARELYTAIAHGYGVDTALSEARKAMYINQPAYEWATPVLYMRARDGKIFDIAKLSDDDLLRLQLGARIRRATTALEREQFPQALAAIQEALNLDGTNARARQIQTRIIRERDAAKAYGEGKALFDQAKWAEALDAFRRLLAEYPDYRDANTLAATAQANMPAVTRANPASAYDPLESHYDTVAKALLDGTVVPFLGSGVNLVDRPDGTYWHAGTKFLPDGRELAQYLAERFEYNEEDRQNLNRVSQFAFVTSGLGPLYKELHRIFAEDYPPTKLHHFLAAVPSILRVRGVTDKYPIIVTANYDDLLERAFQEANEPYDLIWYVADSKDDMRRKFVHRAPDGTTQPIRDPDRYREVRPDLRTVIVKLHGAVDRIAADRDSYVITEDHYLDYLTNSDVLKLAPITLRTRLTDTHFLFMGYSLRDWNLRVLLYRIWGAQELGYNSWAIQLNPPEIDIRTWQRRNVEMKDKLLDEYVVKLERRLRELASGSSRA